MGKSIRTALLALDMPKKVVQNTHVDGTNVSKTERTNLELLHEGNGQSRIAGMGVSSNFCKEEKHCGNSVNEKEHSAGLSRWLIEKQAVEDDTMHHRNKFAQMKTKAWHTFKNHVFEVRCRLFFSCSCCCCLSHAS